MHPRNSNNISPSFVFYLRVSELEKIIFEIERQIQRLQAAKKLLLDTKDSSSLNLDNLPTNGASPVKRGRGRPRKNPLPPSKSESNAA